MFRSVEGQAASDEEEDKWTGEQQKQVDEVKRILSRLSCCEERYSTTPSAQTPGPAQNRLRTSSDPAQDRLRTGLEEPV